MRHSTKLLVSVATVLSTVAFAGAGWAYWATSGSGSGAASVATLAPPTGVTVPANSAGTVLVNWTASSTASPNVAPSGYHVQRYVGTTPSDACGTSPTSLTTSAATSCSDTGVSDGTYTYTVTAVFQSWTAQSTASGQVIVSTDNVRPTVSAATLVTSTPTNLSSVQWSVIFSENVTGVDTTDFSLTNTGLGGTPTVTGVTGSGSTYTVTASTGTGSGTLRLNVLNDGTIKDLATNALSGTTFSGATSTIDRTAPGAPTGLTLAAGQDSGSSATDGITNVNSPQFTGAAEANSTIQLLNGETLVGTGTTNGSGTFTASLTSPLADGAYTITATATDAAGNTSGPSTGKNITVDTTAPTVTNVTLANGNGTVAFGDTVTILYSERMDATKFCATWANSGNQLIAANGGPGVTVTITEAGTNDALTATTGTCTFTIGSVALGGDYVALTRTFGGNTVANQSTLGWDPVARTLTVKLGTPSGAVKSSVLTGTPIYTPAPGLADLAGNALSISPVSGTSTSGF